jgi:hypothetical protein
MQSYIYPLSGWHLFWKRRDQRFHLGTCTFGGTAATQWPSVRAPKRLICWRDCANGEFEQAGGVYFGRCGATRAQRQCMSDGFNLHWSSVASCKDMAAKQSFCFISTCILCLATCGSRANRNAGTKTLGNIALNPYKQAIFLHQCVIKILLVQYGIGAT